MLRARTKYLIANAICLILSSLTLFGCGTILEPSPRQHVIKFFGAMERNDRPAIINSLDLVSLMQVSESDYALKLETPRVMQSPISIVDDLTEDGQTKQVWFRMTRVVGDQEIIGDTAYVEVSFLSESKGVQYYNKFGLRKIGEGWRIFSFRTLNEEGN
ncbi:MAG: hypothetical protein IIB00_03200 [candidate division Zixibacteria bacterium]|nr:hypothetical protein [candidate division Zixibacteria bacterium]